MDIDEAVKKACEKDTLIDALTFICVWESERIVKQARENEQWETCFKVCLSRVLAGFVNDDLQKRIKILGSTINSRNVEEAFQNAYNAFIEDGVLLLPK